jgi:threonylcarbamoyladenosine tRNA methylthiotransferase MtaB
LVFVRDMDFAKLHIFRYSRREGTPAAAMKGQVSGPVVQERSRQMHVLNAELETAFRRRLVGRAMPVLWESAEPSGLDWQWSGLTNNYARVVTHTAAEVDLRNRVIETRLVGLTPAAVLGQF